MRKVLTKISDMLTDTLLEKCIVALVVIGFGVKFLPPEWNNTHGLFGDPFSTVVFFVSLYLTITILLFMQFRKTGSLVIYLLFLLSWGKVTDQFYSPYNWSLVEQMWDVSCLLFVGYVFLNCKKKNEQIGK